MKKAIAAIILACFVLIGSTAIGQTDSESNTIYVKAPVSIGNIGIQNLVVGISYQSVSPDAAFLKSPEYKNFLNAIVVEMQGAAVQEILSHPYLNLDELAGLAQGIKEKITALVDARVEAAFQKRQLTIPVSIANMEFYTTERTTLSIKHDDQ